MIVKMNNDITKFLIGTGASSIMISLNRTKITEKNIISVADLAKTVDITYSHTFNIVRRLKIAGLVRITKTGRRNNITFTDDGKEVSKLLSKLYDKLESIDEI